MKDTPLPASIIRFNLRDAPMGFDSGAPWRVASAPAVETVMAPAAPFDPAAVAVAVGRRPKPRRRPRWVGLAVFALLAFYAVLAWTGSLDNGPSFDEGMQLAVGYNLWLNDDYRIEGANGDLIKRWATLPYLVTRPNFVGRDDRFWRAGAPYELGHRFLFQLGNRPEWLLQQGRAMVVLLGVATGLLVFAWGRELFGAVGGLIALGLFTLSPHMLAFGGIVSTDMSITLTLLAATWCIWRLLHRVTWARLGTSLAVFGALVLAKPTALVILPVAAVLVLVKLLGGRELVVRLGSRESRLDGGAQLRVIALLVGLHALAAWGALWAHYGFRYAASPDPADPSLQIYKLDYRDGTAAPLRSLVRWLREHRIVPEGFHHGVRTLTDNDDETVSFMAGEWTVGGRPDFFPYAMWVKTSPVVLVLLGVSLAVWWHHRRATRTRTRRASGVRHPTLYALAPLLALIVCYLAVAMTEDLNIGLRHVLPVYPALYMLAGGVGWLARRWPVGAKTSLVVAALAWPAVESVTARPDYLTYFGPQVGGADHGYKHLVDSSFDWGMGLPGLKTWLDEHNHAGAEPVYLGYFGTDSPSYHGIVAQRLPGFFDRRPTTAYALTPGYYAISATLLQSLYVAAFGPWSKAYEAEYQTAFGLMRELEAAKATLNHAEWARLVASERWARSIYVYDVLRFGRLCAWLRHRRAPDARVGGSILVWRLNAADLRAALVDAPVELTDDPLPQRYYAPKQPVKD